MRTRRVRPRPVATGRSRLHEAAAIGPLDLGLPFAQERRDKVKPALAVLIALLAGCTSTAGPTPTTPVTVVATNAPARPAATHEGKTPGSTVVATPETSTASPVRTTRWKPLPVEVLRFHQIGRTVFVEIYNPNTDVALVRAGFELAILSDYGTLTVAGGEGVIGDACCTIYNLPAGGRYVLQAILPGLSAPAASVELTVHGQWEREGAISKATVTVTNVSLQIESDSPTITGRVAVDDEGPIDPVVVAMIEGRGEAFSAVVGVPVECIGGGRARVFELTGDTGLPPDPELGDVYAYPTTVTGAGDPEIPPNC